MTKFRFFVMQSVLKLIRRLFKIVSLYMGKKSTTKKRGKNVDMHSFVFFSSDCSQNLNPMSRSESLKLRSSMQNKDRFPISGSDF